MGLEKVLDSEVFQYHQLDSEMLYHQVHRRLQLVRLGLLQKVQVYKDLEEGVEEINLNAILLLQ